MSGPTVGHSGVRYQVQRGCDEGGIMTATTTRTRAVLRRAVLMTAALLCLSVAGCASDAPPPLAVRAVPADVPVDPAAPCSREAPDAGAPERRPPARVSASFDPAANKIVLRAGEDVSLPALSRAVDDPAALRELAPGEWLLEADLEVLGGSSLRIAAPDVRWLKLSSGPRGFASVTAQGGGIDITGACITSWDTGQRQVDTDHEDGRSFLLARGGAQMTIDRAELRYLGHGDVESYGLAWRLEGSGGSITNSVVSHLYFGLYSYEVRDLVVTDNEFSHNVVYGVDPHTGSRNLRIERNLVHSNGKHGIILAEDCTDSVIRENVVYANQHHGIVLYLRSDRNVVEQNESFRNSAQGINVNESSGNVIRANRVYENIESGIAVGQSAQDNLVERNEIRANQQDGVRLVSASTRTDIRDNTIGENSRYGAYVDSDGEFTMAGNTIFGSQAGVLLAVPAVIPEDANRLFDNSEADIKNR